MDTYTNTSGSLVISPMVDSTALVDVFQPAAHVPSRPSSAASTSHPASATSGSLAPSQSRLVRRPLTSGNSTEPIPPPMVSKRENDSVRAVTVARGSGQAKDVSSNNPDGTVRASTNATVDLSSALSSRLHSNPMPTPRATIIGAMKPKRGPSVPQGPKRVTRSVSMKEQRVKGEHTEVEGISVEGKGQILILITSKY